MSFSIKKPKDDVPKEIKSALPLEESSEEESEDKNVTTEASTTPPIVKSPVVVMQTVEESNGTLDEDPILEMIDLTDDSEDRKEIRRGKFGNSRESKRLKLISSGGSHKRQTGSGGEGKVGVCDPRQSAADGKEEEGGGFPQAQVGGSRTESANFVAEKDGGGAEEEAEKQRRLGRGRRRNKEAQEKEEDAQKEAFQE